MDCAQFEKVVHDLERLGTEGFALRGSALAHAESCSRCARLMKDTESLNAYLREVARREAGKEAPPRVGTLLMEEFRRQRTASSRRRAQRQIAVLGVAAAVLLALGLSLHRWSAPVTKNVVGTTSPAPTESPVVSPVTTPANSQQQGQQSASQGGDSEYTTAFVPLPYADDPTVLDDGAVVRVVMPRAALASFGLPVAAMESDETVPADLIVSADGTPQAIRLVSQTNASNAF